MHVVTEGIQLWNVGILVATHTLGAVQLHFKLRKFLHACVSRWNLQGGHVLVKTLHPQLHSRLIKERQ